jgi:hypothetical protein
MLNTGTLSESHYVASRLNLSVYAAIKGQHHQVNLRERGRVAMGMGVFPSIAVEDKFTRSDDASRNGGVKNAEERLG